ncbi:MAG: sodium:proton antiporter [Rhodospirillales bacterium]|nr:sodium:proton antiporter [Rhodospirillales bacterium]
MTLIIAICVGVTFAVSIYMLLGRELKGIAMGVFLIGHAANMSIIAMSRSPIIRTAEEPEALKIPPVLGQPGIDPQTPLNTIADPLPQALILTAIVIGFAVMAFLLTLIVQTARVTGTLRTDTLGGDGDIVNESQESDPSDGGDNDGDGRGDPARLVNTYESPDDGGNGEGAAQSEGSASDEQRAESPTLDKDD